MEDLGGTRGVATIAVTAVTAFGLGWLARKILAGEGTQSDADEDEWEDIDSSDDDDDEMSLPVSSLPPGYRDGLALLQNYPQEECKMVLLVRTDLKMTKGKIAAQCGHAVLACYKASRKFQKKVLMRWEGIGQAKVALKVSSDEELDTLMMAARANGLIAMSIRDAGRTQIAAGSRTVVGIGPAPKSAIDEICGHLKLL